MIIHCWQSLPALILCKSYVGLLQFWHRLGDIYYEIIGRLHARQSSLKYTLYNIGCRMDSAATHDSDKRY